MEESEERDAAYDFWKTDQCKVNTGQENVLLLIFHC
jgi:hypothetical protein